MQWKGPFTITEKVNAVDYKVNIKGEVKTYHGNMQNGIIEDHTMERTEVM